HARPASNTRSEQASPTLTVITPGPGPRPGSGRSTAAIQPAYRGGLRAPRRMTRRRAWLAPRFRIRWTLKINPLGTQDQPAGHSRSTRWARKTGRLGKLR